MNKNEIIRASKDIFIRFTDTCLQIPDGDFFLKPAKKWSIAQNADHLVRSIKATRLAYSLPKFFIRATFGKPNRSSKAYEDVVAKYKLKLAHGGKASGRYIPKITIEKKFPLIQKWQKESEKYLESLDLRWNDTDLDQYLAPHPLLGRLTLRELCYFTMYHTEHHLNIIKLRLAEQLK